MKISDVRVGDAVYKGVAIKEFECHGALRLGDVVYVYAHPKFPDVALRSFESPGIGDYMAEAYLLIFCIAGWVTVRRKT